MVPTTAETGVTSGTARAAKRSLSATELDSASRSLQSVMVAGTADTPMTMTPAMKRTAVTVHTSSSVTMGAALTRCGPAIIMMTAGTTVMRKTALVIVMNSNVTTLAGASIVTPMSVMAPMIVETGVTSRTVPVKTSSSSAT